MELPEAQKLTKWPRRIRPKFRPDRIGMKMVAAHLPEATHAQLKSLAAHRDVELVELVGEALNDLFAKYGRPPLPVRNRSISGPSQG